MDVTATMRPFLTAVWESRDPLVEKVARLVTRQVPTYSVTPSSEVWIGMTRILERIVLGDPYAAPTKEDRDAAIATGLQGGLAGITAADMMAATLLGAREVEAEVQHRACEAGIPADVLLEAAVRSRAWVEQVAVWAAEGLGTTGPGSAAEERRQGDLMLAALRRRAGHAELRGIAARLGLDLAKPHFVVVARPTNQRSSGVDTASLRFGYAGQALWMSDREATVGVVPQPPQPNGSLVVGLAGPVPLATLAEALSEAERASRAAAALAGPGVHTLDSLGLLVPLHDDPELQVRLRRRWLVPLEPGAHHHLEETIRSWQRHGGQVELVAEDLVVHANTVRNRLARIDQHLGAAWRSPNAQAEIWAALVEKVEYDSDSL